MAASRVRKGVIPSTEKGSNLHKWGMSFAEVLSERVGAVARTLWAGEGGSPSPVIV